MHKKYPILVIVIILSIIISVQKSEAQLIYTTGHADIGVAYEDGNLVAHWHGTVSGGSAWNLPEAEYAPDEVVAQVGATRASASNSASYLGVATGSQIYVAGLINFQPWLGFGAEELAGADWNGDLVIKLTDWVVPENGNFAMYTTNNVGTVTGDIYLSTYNPSATNDPWGLDMGPNVFGIGVGGHDHYTFGFTEGGHYEITLEFSGTHVTDGAKSVTATFGFDVIPEPSTYASVLIGALALFFFYRNRAIDPNCRSISKASFFK